jgi:hypothetical protein
MARSISSYRLDAVKKLGAICALLLINGQCPDPFNPLIFQYLINNFNLHSLHERLVGEWHPELRATIRNWIDMGETGDVAPFRSHFATYHNQSVRILLSSCFHLMTYNLAWVSPSPEPGYAQKNWSRDAL